MKRGAGTLSFEDHDFARIKMLEKPQIGDHGVYDIGIFSEFVSKIPDNEQKNLLIYIYNITNLNSLLNDFISAVSLFDFIEIQENMISLNRIQLSIHEYTKTYSTIQFWKHIASRDAAMTIFHVHKSMDFLQSNIRSNPSFDKICNKIALKEARLMLRKQFPDAEALRNAVGHRAEILSSSEEIDKHMINGSFILPNIKGRTYTITFKKAHRSLNVDKTSLALLRKIVKNTFSAFPEIENLLPPIPNDGSS